ncbi:transmembrane protein, putative (macronuclear) [Tetrahymena thermophila SB210]|uniref:Transmembrane protein, putative n=1 Tax=Tetrahymena thermophila (strain SB210) TaxID=312017 RepID=Q244W5_TETTS|nr:transmembrane protein, putative [Tetrahymena thermophila SB210]EAS03372.2 transmembrane protein, putative [Tetrahymena thermophila SB210]|eukprot:XP_001023617.2 transmembrane protein, putative [Tetrahymena thermophila SB210]
MKFMFIQLVLVGLIIKEYLCNQCPDQQIFDALTNSCLQCSDSCQSCFNIDDKSCITCPQNTFRSSDFKNSCVQTCKNNEISILIENQNTCVKCSVPGCISCNALQVCQQCDTNFYLDQNQNLCILNKQVCESNTQFIQNPYLAAQCVQTCPQQQYSNYNSQICEQTLQCIQVQSKSSQQFNQQILQIQSINQKQFIVRARACNIGLVDENSNIIFSKVLQSIDNFDSLYGFKENESEAISFISGLYGGCSAGNRFTVMNFSTLQIEFDQNINSDYIIWKVDDENQIVFLQNILYEYNLVYYDIVSKQIHSINLGLGIGFNIASLMQGRYFIFYNNQYQVGALQKDRSIAFKQFDYDQSYFPLSFIQIGNNLILQVYYDSETNNNNFLIVNIQDNVPQTGQQVLSIPCQCKDNTFLSQSLILALQYDTTLNTLQLTQFDQSGKQLINSVILTQQFTLVQTFENVSLNSFFVFLSNGNFFFANITDFIYQYQQGKQQLDISQNLIPVDLSFIQSTSTLVNMTFQSNNIVNLFFSQLKDNNLYFQQLVKIQYNMNNLSFKISYIDSFQMQNFYKSGYYSLPLPNYAVTLNQMMLYIDKSSNSYSLYSIDQANQLKLPAINIYQYDLAISLQNLQKKSKILTKSHKLQLSQNDGKYSFTRFIGNQYIILTTDISNGVQEQIIDLSSGQQIYAYNCGSVDIQQQQNTNIYYIQSKNLLFVYEIYQIIDLTEQNKVFIDLSSQPIDKFIILSDETFLIYYSNMQLIQVDLSSGSLITLSQQITFIDFLYIDQQSRHPLISNNDLIYLYSSTFQDGFYFTYLSQDTRNVYFQNNYSLYKLDMQLKVLQQLQSNSRSNYINGILDTTQYIKKEKNIIDTKNMIISKRQSEINIYIGQAKFGDTQAYFFQSEQGLNWHKNLYNFPYNAISMNSNQILLDQNIKNNKFLVAVYDSSQKIISIYDIQKYNSEATQINFSISFTLNIKFLDWQQGIFIYVQGNILNQYNSSTSQSLQNPFNLQQNIEYYDVCPQQQILVAQTKTDVIKINLQDNTQVTLTDFLFKLKYFNQLTNPISFTLDCDQSLIILEQPCFYIFDLITGMPSFDFFAQNFIFGQKICANPLVYKQQQQFIIIYPTSIFQFVQDNSFPFPNDLSTSVLYPNILECQLGQSQLFNDINYNVILAVTGSKRHMISIRKFPKYLQTFDYYTQNIFTPDLTYFYSNCQTFIVFDQSQNFYLINYLSNNVTYFQVSANNIKGLLVEESQNMTFLYSDQLIYIYRFPTMDFIETFSLSQYGQSPIQNIFFNTQLHILTAITQSALVCFDLVEVLYTSEVNLKQYQNIQNIVLNDQYQIYYSEQNYSINLLNKEMVVDNLLFQPFQHQVYPYFTQLVLIGQNQFIYVYFTQLYIIQVNLQTQKLSSNQPIPLQGSPDNFFFDQPRFQLLILYKQIYQLTSISLQQQQTQQQEVNLIKFTEGITSLAFICGDYVILPSVNIISVYSIKSNSIAKINISSGIKIQFVFKLQSKQIQANYWWKIPFEYEERYNSNDFDSSQNQQTNFLCVVYQSSLDSSLVLVNLQTMQTQNNLLLKNTIITNIVNDPFRKMIYVVTNKGVTNVYNQFLGNIGILQNSCLKQAIISFDSNFIYSVCPLNIIIYNGLSLQQYLVINSGLQEAYNIVNVQFNNYFLIFQKSKVDLVQIFQNSTYKVYFENNGLYQELQVLQLQKSTNGQQTLNFIVSSKNNIQNLVFPLTDNQQNCNIFIEQQNRSLESTYSAVVIDQTIQNLQNIQNSKLQLIEIVYMDQQQIGSIQSNYFNSSQINANLTLRMESKSTMNQIYWQDGSIYSQQIQKIQIYQMQLNVNALNLNTQGYMKTLQISSVTLNVTQSLVLTNFISVYLQNINLIIPNTQAFQSITISNCNQLFIEQLTLNKISTLQNVLIKISNVNTVVIKKLNVFGLSNLTVFSLSNVQDLQIQSVDVQQSQGINLIQIQQNKNMNVENIQLISVSNSKILNIFGAQTTIIQQITLKNSTSLSVVDIQELVLNSITYNCQSYQLSNVIINNSTDISFDSSVDTVQIQNLTLNQIINNQKNIFNIAASQFLLNNTIIQQSQTNQNNIFAINVISIIDLHIQNFTSSYNQIQMICVKQQKDKGQAQLISSQFLNNIMTGDNPLISLQNVVQMDFIFVIMKDNTISGNTYSSLLQISQSNQVTINSSNFTSNINYQGIGGAISITESLTLKLNQVIFSQNICSKQNGGAINFVNTLYQGQIIANYAQFMQNQAPISTGGAININNINVQMQNSQLSSNKAQIGGAIFYQLVIPDFVLQSQNKINNNNIINNNYADIFGKNIGSTLRKIQVDLQGISAPNTTSIVLQNENLIVSNIQSGQQIIFHNINILDEENNPIYIPSISSQKKISNDVIKIINQIYVQVICDQSNLQIQCLGELKSNDFSNGGFTLTTQLIYKPLSNMQFRIVSNIQPQLADSKGNIYISQGLLEFNVQINFSQCQVGQILKQFSQSTICDQCLEGKYSLNINDGQCNPCPDSALKCEGSQIYLKNGYWRSSELSDDIINCSFNPDACQAEDPESIHYCQRGHVGIICNNCDTYGEVWGERYAENFGTGVCQKCSDNMSIIIANNLLKLFLIIIYIMFMIRNLQKQIYIKLVGHYITKSGMLFLGNSYKSDKSKIFSKILTDHLQILSLVCGMFNIPLSITLPIQITGNPLNSISKSIDCAIGKNSNAKPIWFYNLLWSFFLPLLTILVYLIFATLLYIFKRRSTLKFFRSAAIFIYFYYFTSIVTVLSRSLNCFSIGSENYLDLDLSIKCYDSKDHLPYALSITLPLLIFYGILIPITLFIKIYLMHKRKVSIIIKTQYSFIFAGFKDAFFYWEFYKIFYKTSLILVFVLLKQNPFLQVALVNIFMIINFFLLVRLNPYSRKIYNNYQVHSTFICALTLNLYFLQSYSAKMEATEDIILLIVALLNIQFIIRLAFGIIRIVIPQEKEDRNNLQKLIFFVKKKFPRIFENIVIQNQKNIAVLLKLKNVQKKIKGLIKTLKSKSIYDIMQIQEDAKQKETKISKDIMIPMENMVNSNSAILQNNQIDSLSSARNNWNYYTRMTKSIKLQQIASIQNNVMSPQHDENQQLAKIDSDLNIQEYNNNIQQQITNYSCQFLTPQQKADIQKQNLLSSSSQDDQFQLDKQIQKNIKKLQQENNNLLNLEKEDSEQIQDQEKQLEKYTPCKLNQKYEYNLQIDLKTIADDKKNQGTETQLSLFSKERQMKEENRQASQLTQPLETDSLQKEKNLTDQSEKLLVSSEK